MAKIIHEANEYVIPRGRVYFAKFNDAGVPAGETYLGNCPGLKVSIETEKAEHFSSEAGLREKDASMIVQITRTGELTCDNFSAANLGLFLAASRSQHAQATSTAQELELAVVPGNFYQLGATATAPAGVRGISNVKVTDTTGATTYKVGEDYQIDDALGRLHIVPGGAIAAGDIKVTFDVAAAKWDRLATGAAAETKGALRLVADNASGPSRDWYFPSVTLMPNGDIPLIEDGTDFVQMQFKLDVLKPNGAEAIYVDGRPHA